MAGTGGNDEVADLIVLSETDPLPPGLHPSPVEWEPSSVQKWLAEELLLPPTVVAKFTEAEVTGEDLVALTADELRLELGITKLQANKIKRALAEKDPIAAEELDDKEGLAARAESLTGDPPAPAAAPAPAVAKPPAPVHRAPLATPPPAQPSPAATVPAAAVTVVTGVASAVISSALIGEWTAKTSQIAKLEGEQVSSKYPAAQQRLEYLKALVEQETRNVQQLQEEWSKVDAKAKDLREGGYYLGKFILGKKRHENKVGKTGEKADERFAKLEAAKDVLASERHKLQVQEQLVAELAGKAATLAELQRWEAHTLQSAFTGVAGSPAEWALETEVNALVPRLEETRRYKVNYAQAYELVKNGRKLLERANQLFQSAFGLAGFDVAQNFFRPRQQFRQGAGGMALDMVKRSQARQATAMCAAAAGYIQRAVAIIPGMPRIDLKRVQGLRGLGIMDVVFDNIISDLRARRQLKQSLQLVSDQLRDVVYAERWLEGWLNGRIDQDLAALQAQYAHKKAELDNERRRILQDLSAAATR